MNRAERINSPEAAAQAIQDGLQKRMWTALPGIIEAVDLVKMTARVQPAVQGIVQTSKNTVGLVSLPLLVDCPIQFPGGGGASLTFPVASGDECLVIFASRGIDWWWALGGVQQPAEMRMHDLSDGFVLLGFRSVPRTLTNVSPSATQLRSDDGATSISLDPAAHTIDLTAPGGVGITANVNVTGNLHVTGTISSDTGLSVGGVGVTVP